MGNRRKAREVSLQLLYEWDLSRKDPEQVIGEFERLPERIFDQVGEPVEALEEILQFIVHLTRGVTRNVGEIDRLIENHATHWKLARMSVVDRNILRMAVFELLYCPDIPASVTMNEAIEIAKRYGTEESGSFVNGILDHVAKEMKKL